MEWLNREYITILSAEFERASARFWTLYERIRNDQRLPGVRLEMRKSTMIYDLAHLLADEVICLNDLTSVRIHKRLSAICARTLLSNEGNPCRDNTMLQRQWAMENFAPCY